MKIIDKLIGLVELRMLMKQKPEGILVGLDVGRRKVGVSITRPQLLIPVPRQTALRDKEGTLIQPCELSRLVASEQTLAMVVGLPLSMNGQSNKQCLMVASFVRDLLDMSHERMRVLWWNERLSTQTVLANEEFLAMSPKDIDAAASAYILQGVIDAIKSNQYI